MNFYHHTRKTSARFVTLAVLAALLLGCTAEPAEPAEPVEPAAPAVAAQEEAAPPAAPVEDAAPPEETQAEAVEAQDAAVQLSKSDACSYLSEEQIAGILAAPVTEIIPAESDVLNSCTYIILPGEQFVTVSVYQGEAAKRYLIHETAQMRGGCSLSYLFSTDPEEPTPFPPELEAEMGSTLLDLFLRDLESQQACGAAYKALPELGSNVYTFSTFIQGALIGIAGDDIYLTLLYADANLDFDAALALAVQLTALAVIP